MTKEKIIGMLSSICILLSACSEQEENMSLINNAITEKESINVRLSLSSIPEIQTEGNTDYRPMFTRAEGNIRAKIAKEYKCLVMKELNEIWYVDTLMKPSLSENVNWRNIIEVRDDTKFNDLELTLRPGHYRVLVVLNPRFTIWNPNLVPGAFVKNEPDTITHAYTYYYQPLSIYGNQGKLELHEEIFVGTADFIVEKTSDLHSASVKGNTTITLTRKVMQFRFLLKNQPSDGTNKFNFKNTPHTLHATLKAPASGQPFCDGLDCWGNAYYNRHNPTREMNICTSLLGKWHTAITGQEYQMIGPGSTIYSPFVFSDNTKKVPYQLEKIKIYGQSGSDGFVYVYNQPIPDLVLENNTIQQIVFRTTEEVDTEASKPQRQVTLEYLKEESAQNLFNSYYECNIP